MSKHGTAIEWTHGEGFKGETWNPVTGCSKVSPGCAHCYAETLSLRFGWSPAPWTPENAERNVRLRPERLDQPLRWRRPRMIFVNSMSDLFHELIPDSYIYEVFRVMAQAERHTFQVLTKRPERARSLLANAAICEHGWLTHNGENPTSYGGTGEVLPNSRGWPLPNVWLGVSIENARYTWRADVLREIPAAVRFISAEPLLGSLYDVELARDRKQPADIPRQGSDESPGKESARPSASRVSPGVSRRDEAPTASDHGPASLDLTGIDWLIVGGESGPGARPMQVEWARELRDACQARTMRMELADEWVRGPDPVPFFFKQVGGRTAKSGGKLLDGREWCEMPKVAEFAAR